VLSFLSIRHRLLVSFAAILAILLMVSAAGLWAVREIRENLRVVYEERAIPVQLLSQVNYLMQRNRVLVMDMLVNPSEANSRKRLAEFEANVKLTNGALSQYAAISRPAEQSQLYDRFLQARDQYMNEALVKASEAMAKADFDEAQFLYLNKISPLAPPFQASMDALIESQLSLAGKDYAEARQMAQGASVTVGAMVGLGLLLGLLLAWLVARSITRPIAFAERLAEQVEQGDLTQVQIVPGHDEMARLVGKLDQMRGRLADIVKEVREGSQLIAASTGEISQGVNDLSQRTESQAANLEEASASLASLLEGTRVHGEVSSRASAIARVAHDGASAGGEAVSKLITQIGTVNERSKRITEITSVIDSIAFQTNILALNAAVEAARAGEQGRGFAVVAQEVRVLAQRSAAAASEIKNLIGDAVHSVEQEPSMASETGAAVQGIVNQVKEVDDLIGQLNQASAEQSLQLDQINEAINHIDNMTQKNAALVEENAAATTSLNHEAGELERRVSSFKLGDGRALALSYD